MTTELDIIAPTALILPADRSRFVASIGNGSHTLPNCEIVPGKTTKSGITSAKFFFGSDASTAEMMRDLRAKIAANRGISKTQAKRELSKLLQNEDKGAVNARISVELALAAKLVPTISVDGAAGYGGKMKVDAAGNLSGMTLDFAPVAEDKQPKAKAKVEAPAPAPAPTIADLAKGKSRDELLAMMAELSAIGESIE